VPSGPGIALGRAPPGTPVVNAQRGQDRRPDNRTLYLAVLTSEADIWSASLR